MRKRRIVTGAMAVALAVPVLPLVLYGLAGWAGSSLARGSGEMRPAPAPVTIMVESNGVHTALVLPLVTPQKDWRTDFPLAHIADPARPYTHVSVSWGEHDVFINTPTWWDLRPATVWGIIAGKGEAALHIAHYVRPAPGPDIRPVHLSAQQYARLIAAIEPWLLPQARRHAGYANYDVFYHAPGTYSLYRTCNQWTGDMLASAGVPMGRWTPFAGGVMKWIAPPEG